MKKCAGLIIWCVILVPCPAAAPPLVIQGGNVFDAVTGKMAPNGAIVIEGQKIRVMTKPEDRLPPLPQARILDARDKFIIPGLIDAHVHLVHRLNFAHVTGDEVLPLFLANGVTSVRDTGDEIVAQTAVAHFAEAKPELCPRVFTCSYLLDADPPIHRDIGYPITDPAKVPALVEEMLAWKVTTLKIYARQTRGVGRRVIEEGHKKGLIVTGHLSAYPAQEAIEDGIDCLEHITTVFDFIIPSEAKKQPRANLDLNNPQAKALIATLAKRKVFVDPTLTVFRNMLLLSDVEEIHNHPDNLQVPERLRSYWHQYRRGQGLSPATRERRKKEFQKYQELTGLLYREGVTLLVGTDAPEPFCPPGLSLHQELEWMVESGIPPAAVLQAATLHNARSLKQEKQLGSVSPGMLADLVVLDADPLADIRNTRKIHRIVRGGIVCEPKALLEAVPKK